MKNIISTSVLCLIAFAGTFAAVRGYLEVSTADASVAQPARHEATMQLHPKKVRQEPNVEPVVWAKPTVISAPRPSEKKVECWVRDLTQGSGQVRICDKVVR